MQNPPAIETFRDPAFSLWQSTVHAALLKRAEAGQIELAGDNRGLAATSQHPAMLATVAAINALQAEKTGGAASAIRAAAAPGAPFAGRATTLGSLAECAKLAAEIAWSLVFDQDKVPALRNELKDSPCDLLWAETLAEYALSLASGLKQPYTVYPKLEDGVIEHCFPNQATVAVISDWGTGSNAALVLLQQIANNFKPQVLLHLGDIYYSGLKSECQDNFTKLIAEVWPKNPPLVYTLSGNHDRYAGAAGGYYPLIAALNPGTGKGQPNSYFALRNDFWQFVATDTGYHDSDPFTVATNLTHLEDTEVAWHLDKIRNSGVGVDKAANPSGVRGTVLLSHHPLFSRHSVGQDKAGRPLAVNTNLAGAFAPVAGLVDFWLWGHEHDLLIFEPYTAGPGQPLPPGRCVGSAAVPVFSPMAPADANLTLPAGEKSPPATVPGTSLATNGNVFDHAYAIVTLNKAELTIRYYQLDSTDAKPGKPPALVSLAFADHVVKPKAAAK